MSELEWKLGSKLGTGGAYPRKPEAEIKYGIDTELLNEMRKEQDKLLHEPDPQAARDFMHKWNEGEGVGMTDNVIMAGIHKVRINRGIGVGESKIWLLQHGYKEEILYHGEPV